MPLLKLTGKFPRNQRGSRPLVPQQTTVQSFALTGRLLWKKLQVWLTRQAEDPVSDEMKAMSYCLSGAHIRSTAKQVLSCCSWEWRNLNRGIRTSCINLEHQPQKAPRPQGLHRDLLHYPLRGVCALSLLHVSPEKSLSTGTQVRTWCDTPNTCSSCPEKGPSLSRSG